ncbi:MAG: calcium/sodium antiporter [Chromatiales bacterium]|nr:calcium/sodium antiporter [Chromatiales bacterium]
MLAFIAAVVAGLILLVWSADRFVAGAAATADKLRIPSLIIGLTVVGLGTSAPEILVSLTASLEGKGDLAVGNAIGSNIANIALILGLTALISPLTVRSQTLKREYPVLLLVTLLALGLMWDLRLDRIDGVILLGSLVTVLWLLVFLARRSNLTETAGDPIEAEFDAEIPHDMSIKMALFWVVVGLILLVIASRTLVWGATGIASALGVSDLIIGLTIVAIGTSLPELAASMMSALKNEHDIAIGNVIGSNMFNLLAVLGIPGLVAPLSFESQVITRDYAIMLGLSIALFFLARGFDWRGTDSRPGRINRWEGALLLCAFLGYQWLLYRSVVGA